MQPHSLAKILLKLIRFVQNQILASQKHPISCAYSYEHSLYIIHKLRIENNRVNRHRKMCIF